MNTKYITFFQRFIPDITQNKKMITIRDNEANFYNIGDKVNAYTYELRQHFADLQITDITPIKFVDLNQQHAMQENMTLDELKSVIKEIYPNQTNFFIISFQQI